jgi:cysteine desulfurase
LSHCISITLPKTDTETLVRESENVFSLAQGSACSSKEVEPSHVLTALGLTRELADKTFRVSFPLDVDQDAINILVKEIIKHS